MKTMDLPPASERRTVAILFAGLCDFARLEAALAPERLRDTLDALFKRFRAAVEARGGTVDKFIGDTVMAVFGAPVAHEDDPLRALRAAQEMHRETAAFAAECGLDLALRAGVNHGEVLWGAVAGERPTAMGDVVNVAQRLKELAASGETLAAAPVERTLRRAVRFARLEPLLIRGREEKVEAFSLAEEVAERTGIRRRGPASEFVGRTKELAHLRNAWGADRGGFVVVEGEAGVGKTRLVAEFRAGVRRAGGVWVGVGRALEEVRLPLAAPGEILRGETGAADADRVVAALISQLSTSEASPTDRENFAHLIALSTGLSVPDARVTAIEPARIAAETHHAWGRWIAARAAASGGRALLCVEDLQWADEATLALLESLAARPPVPGLLVLSTARPGARTPAGYQRFPLAELPAAAAHQLAAAALGPAASPEQAAFLAEKAGGHPLYLEELARFLREEPSAAAGIPGGLHGLLVARVDGLPAADREAVKCAAVVGRVFWRALLGSVLGRDAAKAVEELRRREMVHSQPDSLLPRDAQFLFRHALLRDAAYGLLPKRERARLHGAVAGLFEGRIADAGRPAKVLAATHREAAGEAERARALWLEAAQEALEAGAYSESLAHARAAARAGAGPAAALFAAEALLSLGSGAEAVAAIETCGPESALPDGLRARALHLRSRAAVARGEFREAAALARRAAEAAESPARRISAILTESDALVRLGDWEPGLARLREAQEALDAAPDLARSRMGRVLRTQVHVGMGNVHAHRGSASEALAEHEAGLALARETGNLAGVAATLNNIGNARRSLGRSDEALAAYLESLEIDRRTGDRTGLAAALHNIANIHTERQEWAPAETALREALAIRRVQGERSGEAGCLGSLANVAISLGRIEEALDAYDRSLAICREIGDLPLAATCLNNIGHARGHLGDWDGALAAHEESLALRRRMGDRRGIASCLCGISAARRRKGDPAAALPPADEAVSVARETEDTFRILVALQARGLALKDLGRAGEAAGPLQEALDLARRTNRRKEEADLAEALGEP